MAVIVEITNSSPSFHMGSVSGRTEMGGGWGPGIHRYHCDTGKTKETSAEERELAGT